MKLTIYQVDAFTNKVFAGNPAAICPLDQWIDEETMQHIAAENNLSETAYIVKNGSTYDIRWFTPTTEIDLCGHATLASAHIIFKYLNPNTKSITFNYKLGTLVVSKNSHLLEMDFPANKPEQIVEPIGLALALGDTPIGYFSKNFTIAVFDNEDQVKNLQPDFNALKGISKPGIIVTAPGKRVDFVSRVFAPDVGIDEDPVTGSAHTELIPLWAEKLGKTKLTAQQVSKRGGDLVCELNGARVKMAGEAVLYLKGEIEV